MESGGGNLQFFYQTNNANDKDDDAMSPPSSPSADEDELVTTLSHSQQPTAVAKPSSPTTLRKTSFNSTSVSTNARRCSRADMNALQAKAASAKGFAGYDMFGSIAMDFVVPCGSLPLCCQYNFDGSHVAVGLTDGAIKIYDVSSPDFNHLYTLSDELAVMPSQGVTAISYLSSPAAPNIIIGAYTSGHVKIWHTSTGRALTTFTEDRETLNIAVDPIPSGSRLMSVGGAPSIYMYDLVTKQRTATFAPSVEMNVMDGHRQKVFACRFHPIDPHIFYTGGWDNTIQFWDDRQQRAVRSLFGPHICGDALDLDVLHNHLITGSWRTDDVIQIWDWSTLKLIKTVVLPPKAKTQAYCTSWLGTQYILVAGSSDNVAACIDRSSLNVSGLIRDLPGGVYATARHPSHASTNANRFAIVSDAFLIGLSLSV